MYINVYEPQDVQQLRNLKRISAAVHTEAIEDYIMQLCCPSAQKKQIIEYILKKVSNDPDFFETQCF